MNVADIVIILILIAIVAAIVVKKVFFPGPKWERDMRKASNQNNRKQREGRA